MDQDSLQQLILDAREEFVLAKRLTNEYISILDEQIQIESDAHERCLMSLERLKLKIDLRILKGKLEEKLTEMNGGIFVQIE